MNYANYEDTSIQGNYISVYKMAARLFTQAPAIAATVEQICARGVCPISSSESYTPERGLMPRKLTHLRDAIFTW